MANFTRADINSIRYRRPGYAGIQVFIETGTYMGASTRLAAEVFPIVHTVEISEALYWRAVALFWDSKEIHCHLGESREFIAQMAKEILEPAIWYLDAHWFARTTQPVGGKAEGLPLWEEIQALIDRPAGDIVIVDDVHCFAGKGPEPGWANVTLESIAKQFLDLQESVILGDQAIIYR